VQAAQDLAKILASIEAEIDQRVASGLDTGDDGGSLYAGPGTVHPVHYTGRGRTNFLRWVRDNLRAGQARTDERP
jgi:hypothetical protein